MPPKVLKKSKNDAGKQKQVAGETTTKPAEQKTASSTSKETQQTGGAAAAKQKPEKKPEKKEEMDAERELSEDAVWKRIQQNTFTRWVNEHLKSANKSIGSLETDLSDGLRLIALIEVLSAKRLSKHNKKPTFRSQKLENCAVSMKFLMEDEGIKIVNIDSSDIVDCKLKLILGLIWTLILHYSISMPMWEGEEEMEKGKSKKTPKQRLLNWVQSKVTEMPISNFTSDWNNGKAIGALVDAVAPGLCPDWENWDPKNALKNAQEAMEMANKWLDIPELIEPSELVNPKLDEMSMMTYLSQFPNAKLKPGAPVRPPTNPKKVRAYGPGIEPNPIPAGCPTNFTIETFSAGQGDVVVEVENPNKQKEPVDIVYNDDKAKTYTCTYVPKLQGPHRVKVNFAGKPIPKSPFDVKVEGIAGDPKKVTCSGPGIEPAGVVAGKPTYFDVSTRDAGLGVIEATVVDPKKPDITVPCKTTKVDDHNYKCEYIAPTPGMHAVNVSFAGRPAAKSPYNVNVSPAAEAKKVKASGRGLQPKGIRVGDAADFKVFTAGAGAGNLDIKVVPPSGQPIEVERKLLDDKTTHECIYRPTSEGRHVVLVSYGGQEISKSPFEVNVGPQKESKIRAFGPGLSGGVVDQPACFTVETNGETGALGFSIEGPSQTKIDCHDNGDGTCDVKYYPKVPGDYAVHILCDNEDIPRSPYMANIVTQLANVNPDKVEAYGPGIQKDGVTIGKPTEFTVDTKKAGGPAPLHVSVMDNEYKPVDVQVKDNKDGTFKCTYKPERPVKHTVQVNYANVTIPNSPYRVNVSVPADKSKVRVFGPGVEKGLISKKRTHFTVDCKEAGKGNVEVAVLSDRGDELPFTIQDNLDSTFTVEYTPPAPGNYKVKTSFDGKEIPKSPIDVKVDSDIDISKIKIEGLEPTAPINSLQQFRVITKDAGQKGLADLGVTITSPTGKVIHGHIVPTPEGFVVNFTPTELGEYLLGISYGGEPVTPIPRKVLCTATAPSESDKVKAYGPGLKGGPVGKPAQFTIDTREATMQAGLGVTIEGPSETPIDCKDNGDGTCGVTYVPKQVGDYDVNVTFNSKHINGSPFKAKVVPLDQAGVIIPSQVSSASASAVQPNAAPDGKNAPLKPADIGKISVSGIGIQPEGVFKDSWTDFLVDARAVTKNGDKKVTCTITNPSGAKTNSVIQNMNDGTYKVCYTPFEEGPHTIQITYDGVPVPGSPFKVNVTKGCDPSKCKAYGPGLERGITNQKNTFTIETKGAGVGGLGLAVEGPSDARIKCVDNKDGSCTVEYNPTEAGDYEIGVKFADQNIPGSPFKVPVDAPVDSSKVTAHGPGLDPNHCRANVPQKFTVDARQSGKAPVDVQVLSDAGPIQEKPVVKDLYDGTYEVSYKTPPEGSKCDVKVTHGGKDIPKSPFQMKVKPKSEPKNVKVSGPGVSSKGVPASLPTDVIIDTKTAGYGDLEVVVVGPDGEPKKTKLTNNGDGTHKATYVPDDVGKYQVKVKYDGQEVPNSPFNVNANPIGNADKCKITEGKQESVTIGEEYCITVNAQQAGQGALTCRIRSSSVSSAPGGGPGVPPSQKAKPKDRQNGAPGDIDISIEDNGDGTFSVYYKVKEPGDYSISLKFGGQNVPNGSYKVKATERVVKEEEITIVETQRITQQTTQHTLQSVSGVPKEFQPVELNNIPIPGTGGKPTAQVKMPSGNIDEPQIIDNGDGTISVKFDPREEGQHEMVVKYNHEHVEGSPFSFFVDKQKCGYITAYGSGLTHGVCGEPCKFIVSTKNAGAGGLSMAIEGPSKAEINCKDNKDGTINVSYLPTSPGEYKLTVKFGGKNIRGSPFTPKITGEGRKRNQISVGHSSEVSLKVTEKDIKNLHASIIAPSGLEEPCFVKKLPNGHLGISFTPREKGEHSVNVKRMGDHINKSPFKIQVGEREIGDASKVKVSGKSLKEGKTQTNNEFTVNTEHAGYGGLSLSIEGPSKADIQCKDNENGTLNVNYKPTEPGYYIINLKFADHHVIGSPFTVKVTGAGSGSKTERIKRDREAAPVTEVGHECKFTVRLPVSMCSVFAPIKFPVSAVPNYDGTNPFDMTSRVTSPNGKTDDAEIIDMEDSTYAVHFVPKELGVHTISIRHKDIHIPGSPFQFTVGPLKEGGAHKVHAGGPGLERGEITKSCEFNVWTREAGAGHLAISVEGPSKAEIDFKDRKDGSCYVMYTVPEQGEYRVGIKFNDQHIPDSPYKVYITPGMGESNKLVLGSLPDNNLEVDKPVSFIIQMNGAHGSPDGKVISPSGKEDDCFVTPVDEDQWACRFIPRENGVHQIQVKLAGLHIPESPFRLRVGKDEADPAALHAYGNGLTHIKTGQKTDFIVDTCNAGSGTLVVTIEGPSKVAMDCTEVAEGYKVRYTPLAPGEYFITVKYNTYHIAGSPFRVPCSGKAVAEIGTQEASTVIVETVSKEAKHKTTNTALPKFKSNASKVTCKGLGLKRAHLNKQNQFNVNCADAGNNMLYVSIHGPKLPVDEVFVKHHGNHTFNVNYMLKERGDHYIVIKYGEEDIPGSPFKIDVV